MHVNEPPSGELMPERERRPGARSSCPAGRTVEIRDVVDVERRPRRRAGDRTTLSIARRPESVEDDRRPLGRRRRDRDRVDLRCSVAACGRTRRRRSCDAPCGARTKNSTIRCGALKQDAQLRVPHGCAGTAPPSRPPDARSPGSQPRNSFGSRPARSNVTTVGAGVCARAGAAQDDRRHQRREQDPHHALLLGSEQLRLDQVRAAGA